jgi:hypothetical protein
MEIFDTILSLDLSPDDCLYRIRRDVDKASRVIYVTVTDISIISEDHRTYGLSVIAELRELENWNGTWDTLTIHKESNRVRCIPDAFTPHAVREHQPKHFSHLRLKSMSL